MLSSFGMSGPRRRASGRALLPAGWLLHRSLAARGARGHHPRARRPRAAGSRPLSRVASGGAGHARPPPGYPAAGAGVWGDPSPRWRRRKPASRGPRAGLGTGPHRASRRGVGCVGRLLRRRRARRPARAQPHVRSVRAGALPLLHYRVHVRIADLSLGAAGRRVRGDRCVVGRERTKRPRERALRLCVRQGPASACRHRLRISARWSCMARWTP